MTTLSPNINWTSKVNKIVKYANMVKLQNIYNWFTIYKCKSLKLFHRLRVAAVWLVSVPMKPVKVILTAFESSRGLHIIGN